MASWKRLFGKKHKKAVRKLEREHDEWLRHVQVTHGPYKEVTSRSDQRRMKRFDSYQESAG